MINRLEFIKKTSLITGFALTLPACTKSEKMESASSFDFKISLAEWCFNKEIFSGEIDHLDFPIVAKKDFGIEAVEYVNQFFPDKATDLPYLNELKLRADDNGVASVLIMIDNEGQLAAADEEIRKQSVENHFKWVEAAKLLGCHSIRVNLHGTTDLEIWKEASINSLRTLSEFGAQHEISIIVENHGSHSSHGSRLASVLKAVNTKWAGTLPDFGNFCYEREGGELWGTPCIAQYDVYEGTKELMPFAKGVSAKSFDFDDSGNETSLDYLKLFNIVKESGFNNGYVGIEYEGDRLPARVGVRLTKELLERVRLELA